MSATRLPYRIYQTGDQAITVDYGNVIDPAVNREVIARFHSFKEFPLPGITEVVPAYSSLLFYYDVVKVKDIYPNKPTAAAAVREAIENRLYESVVYTESSSRQMRIPVCYEPPYSIDMPRMIETTGLSAAEIIQQHSSVSYHVYMLGFLPGFAYMGEVNNAIAVSRKDQPASVEAGSVGIAGRQTGIYSLASPGGWNIIGRTPLRLFDPDNSTPVLLQPGDCVSFYSISKDEFACS
jgi:inhibitor of KinA